MPATRRTTNARENGAHEIQEPLQSSSKSPACQTGVVVPNSPPKHFTPLSVRPDGREIFLPPLDPGRVYQVTIQGSYAHLWDEYKYIFFRTPKKKVFDALYSADNVGNFVQKHNWLSLDGRSLQDYLRDFDASPWEDRAAHKYKFRISGSARRISARLDFPRETLPIVRTGGALAIVFELLPEGTPSPLHFIDRENKMLKEFEREEAAAKEKASRDKKAAEERTSLENKLAALRCRAHREEHFIAPDFQQKYARHHLQEISSKLKGEWGSEYDALMQQPGFKQLAAKQAPEVLAWLEARVNIVRLAEQLLISPPAPQIQKKPRLNAEQVRALKVRWDEIQAADRIARKKVKAKMLVEGRAELESIPLDPDVKESLNTELDEEIRDIGEDNGKGGTTL